VRAGPSTDVPVQAAVVPVQAAVADAHRREWAYVLAATVRVTGDIDLAEECVQDAYAKALTTWPAQGIPARPAAWLTTVARRRGIDVLRRRSTHDRFLPELVGSAPDGTDSGSGSEELDGLPEISDDRLRLIFTCCHPALAAEAQVALTLRLVCGLTTAEVARMFLVQESTMAARLTRTKKKITAAHIPYRVPGFAELPARIDTVLDVVHLVFTTGHTAPAGGDLVRDDLVAQALYLARMLRTLLPGAADVAGLLGLFLLTHARRTTRLAADGSLSLLSEQDRSRWDASEIREGLGLVREALQRRPPGRFALMAAIAAVHAEAPTWSATDWSELVGLYDLLVVIWPSPVVALNRSVAVGFAEGPEAGLKALDVLLDEPQLASYAYLPSARADLLRRLGRATEARAAYRAALDLTDNAVEREFLQARLDELTG
jgi:RNA polymerase sigma factor (sigma-70 family)